MNETPRSHKKPHISIPFTEKKKCSDPLINGSVFGLLVPSFIWQENGHNNNNNNSNVHVRHFTPLLRWSVYSLLWTFTVPVELSFPSGFSTTHV